MMLRIMIFGSPWPCWVHHCSGEKMAEIGCNTILKVVQFLLLDMNNILNDCIFCKVLLQHTVSVRFLRACLP